LDAGLSTWLHPDESASPSPRSRVLATTAAVNSSRVIGSSDITCGIAPVRESSCFLVIPWYFSQAGVIFHGRWRRAAIQVPTSDAGRRCSVPLIAQVLTRLRFFHNRCSMSGRRLLLMATACVAEEPTCACTPPSFEMTCTGPVPGESRSC